MPKNGCGLIVGIDVGGTSTKAALIDPAAVLEDPSSGVLGRAKVDTDPDKGPEGMIKRMARLVDEVCDDAGLDREKVTGAGIAAAGAVDYYEGVVLNAVNLKWHDLPLARLFHEESGLATAVDNDVRAAVYGEQRAGAAKGARDVFGVWVGTGIGGGLILDNELFHGSFGTAGEFGRGMVLPWSPPGEGSVEQVCSRTGIAETLVRLLRSNRESILELPDDNDPRQLKSKEIARAYEKEDELVREVVDHAAQVLGIAIGGVVTLLSLECVVLGGGFVDAMGKPYLARIRDSILRSVFPEEVREVRVVASGLEDDAGPIGAALLAARRLGVRAKSAATAD
jgi:glucokinase